MVLYPRAIKSTNKHLRYNFGHLFIGSDIMMKIIRYITFILTKIIINHKCTYYINIIIEFGLKVNYSITTSQFYL